MLVLIHYITCASHRYASELCAPCFTTPSYANCDLVMQYLMRSLQSFPSGDLFQSTRQAFHSHTHTTFVEWVCLFLSCLSSPQLPKHSIKLIVNSST